MPSVPWSATWGQLGRPGRVAVASALSLLVLACLTMVIVGSNGAIADVNPGAGVEVPADELQMIDAAAASCPGLTPPRLAGQLMANSGFNPQAKRAGGGSGIAGLTD